MRLIDAPLAHLPRLGIRLGAVLAGAGSVGALLFGVGGCGSTGDRAAVTGATVYVMNFHGTEQGRADYRPRDLVLSEFTTLNAMTWRSWGPARAVGTGRLSGSWCLPTCSDAPYQATVTLSHVVPARGKGYFTRYEITAAGLPRDQVDRAVLEGALPTPESIDP